MSSVFLCFCVCVICLCRMLRHSGGNRLETCLRICVNSDPRHQWCSSVGSCRQVIASCAEPVDRFEVESGRMGN